MYPKKTKYAGIILRSKNSIQIIMYFKGARETETLMWDHTAVNIKKCYGLKLAAEKGFKDKELNYAELFPNSEKRFKYISYAGDSLTIIQRLDLHYTDVTERLKAGELEYSTVDGYRKEINRLKNYFEKYHSGMKLSELRTDHLEDWAKNRNIKQKALGEELRHIRTIIKYAIGKSHIVKNILAGWSPTATKKILIRIDGDGKEIYKKDHEKHPFTKEEIKKILSSTLIVAPRQFSFILFRFALGLRPSEIIGLKWSRHDEINNSVHILETVVLNRLKPRPKTVAGDRILALNKPAKEAINIQRKLTYGHSEYIFIDHENNNTNNWWRPETLRRAWAKILIHAEVEHRRPYNTRHSCATQLLEAGKSVYEVSVMLGHANMSTTSDKYVGGKSRKIATSDEVDSFITI